MGACVAFAIFAISYPNGLAVEERCAENIDACMSILQTYRPEEPAVDWIGQCLDPNNLPYMASRRTYKGTESGQ